MFRVSVSARNMPRQDPLKFAYELNKIIPNPSTKVNCYDIVSEHISYGVCY